MDTENIPPEPTNRIELAPQHTESLMYRSGGTTGCWHETKFFCFNYIMDFYVQKDNSSIGYPFLWVFEMQTKQWSEIILDVYPKDRAYNFDIDSDGFLSLIKFRTTGVPFKEEYSVHLTRIPLKSPDKLMNLCWFQARKIGLSEQFPSLRILTDPMFS